MALAAILSAMDTLRKYGKVIIFDTLAIFCFIGVVLFGWLPGPGGIPLFLLGLSLLAVNHDWAERWLETAKHKGVTFKKWLFPDVGWIRLAYDVIAVGLFSLGAYVAISASARYIAAIGTVLMTFSLFFFLLNRERFDKLSSMFRTKRK